MTVAVLVLTDGRDEYLAPTVQSAMRSLTGPIVEWWMHDDTGLDDYRAQLARRYPTFRHINGGPRQGFGGAIRSAWQHLAAQSTARYVLHLEGDFTFCRPVDLGHLAAVLETRPHLAQLALVRQPWNDTERAAGGLLAAHPGGFAERTDRDGHRWLEHRLWWTTNPSLYRRTLILDLGWPDGPQSEGVFTQQLLAKGTPEVGPDHVAFGYWGTPTEGEWVEHIGQHRAGRNY